VCGVNILPQIPIQPISWSAALPILQALGGEPVVTYDGWQGGLPLHYHMGPGPAAVSMHLTVDSAVSVEEALFEFFSFLFFLLASPRIQCDFQD
jgi:hypothetical protein